MYGVHDEVAVGDEYFIQITSRHHGGVPYAGPFKVSKVTKTQITIGAHRYNRKNGKRIGSYGGYYAEAATDEMRAKVKELDRKHKAKVDIKAAEALTQEMASRKLYKADHIDSEEVQKVLGKVRLIADIGRGQMGQFLQTANAATVEEPWNLMRDMDDRREAEDFINGTYWCDMACELHERCVKLVDALSDGKTLKVRDNDATTYQADPVAAVKTNIQFELRRLTERFFSHTVDSDGSRNETIRMGTYIKRLRSDFGVVEYDWPSISIEQDDE